MNDFARHLAVLGDGIAKLETNVAAATVDIRFAHDGLARIHAAHIAALEDFVRDHPVGDPDQLEFDF